MKVQVHASQVRTFEPCLPSVSHAYSAALAGLAFSQDGQWLAIRGPAALKTGGGQGQTEMHLLGESSTEYKYV